MQVALVCGECEGRNYKTSKRASETERIELKKFCPACNKHTVHRESK